MEITPYLFFEGRCEEALAFYHETIGAETLALMRYKDSPEPDNPCGVSPENQDKVMHACFRVGATTIMASDGFCAGKPDFQGFSLSLNAPDETTAQQMFTALGKGGEVRMPLGKTFFAPCFGMLTDRFGVSWMVIVPAATRPQ